MHKFTAQYTKPDDVDGFLELYKGEHLEIVERWPNVAGTSTTIFTGTPRGGEPPVWLQFEARYETADDLRASLGSDAAREAGKHAMELCEKFGITAQMLIGEEQ